MSADLLAGGKALPANCLKVMRQGHRKATGGKCLLAKVIPGRLLFSLDAEGSGGTVEHEDQRKRSATVRPVVFEQNVMPADHGRLLEIVIGTGRREFSR